MIPAEMNSNADWAKCLTTLHGSHLINYAAKIVKLIRSQAIMPLERYTRAKEASLDTYINTLIIFLLPADSGYFPLTEL